MPNSPGDFDIELPEVWVPPTPEVIEVPADLPTLDPAVTIRLPLNEEITSAVLVPGEHEGSSGGSSGGGDVLYVAVTQERVNVWAAVVYFMPEIAIGLSTLLLLVALRRLWVRRRFTHRPGEAYCKKCWAGLTGVQSDTCPECGKPVKKVKRTARRRLLSMTWVWTTAATAAILLTTGVWFIDSWRGLWYRGFDYRSSTDWWAIIDPLDRDSALRINKTASWFDWHSARLAAFARDKDQHWIAILAQDGAEENTEFSYRLTLRRYLVSDGRLLSEHAFPGRAISQKTQSNYYIALQSQSGIAIVEDNDTLYLMRFDSPEPWILIGENEWEIELTGITLSADSDHLFLTVADKNSAPWQGRISNPKILVFETTTGHRVAEAHFLGSEIDSENPGYVSEHYTQTTTNSGLPVYQFREAYGNVLPMLGDQGVLLLTGPLYKPTNGNGPTKLSVIRTWRWDIEDNLFTSYRAPVDLNAIRWYHIFYQSVDNTLFQNMSRSEQSNLRASLMRQEGIGWTTSDWLEPGRRESSMTIYSEFWPHYDPDSDVLLIDLARSHTDFHPSRVFQIQLPTQYPIMRTNTSSNGRWVVVDYSNPWRAHTRSQPIPSLLFDAASAKPLGWVRHSNYGWSFAQFANAGSQYIRVQYGDVAPSPQHSREIRHEILIFDLPDSTE